MSTVLYFSRIPAEGMNFFVEARKRSTREKSADVINLEPLASIELKVKSAATPVKQKAEMSIPVREKMMVNAFRSIRSSKQLARLRSGLMGASGSAASGNDKKIEVVTIEVEDDGPPEDVYVPCWNLSKLTRLILLNEKREWVENIMPPGARVKFEA